MTISPIDSGRYGSEEMRRLFADAHRYALFARIEAALIRAQARFGLVPEEAARAVSARAEAESFPVDRVRAIEAKNRHEVMAAIQAFAEICEPHGRFIHLGATSSDVIDTAIALQLKEAAAIIERKLDRLLEVMLRLAADHKSTAMVGRTHGQHAVPITFGFKVAVWADQLMRQIDRFEQLKERILVGKLAGAVGSFAGLGEHGRAIQAAVMADLGLTPAAISTQIVPRDRIAELVGWTALLAASLDTIAVEVRNLQRPEIAEVSEFFDDESQCGSSTMPHKRNPVRAENIGGLARMVRSLVMPALETISTWHERDLTNSSVERFTIPQACILTDEILDKSAAMLATLSVHADRMERNLHGSRQSIMAEAVMLALARKGMHRSDAYALARGATQTGRSRELPLHEVLRQNQELRNRMSLDELAAIMERDSYIGQCVPLTESVVERGLEYLASRPQRKRAET